MKKLRSILRGGKEDGPLSQGDKDFVAKHQVQVFDPLDDKAAEENEKTFTASNVAQAHVNGFQHGWQDDEDEEVYESAFDQETDEQIRTTIHEVSQNLLKRYTQKAVVQATVIRPEDPNDEHYDNDARTYVNRLKGTRMAMRKAAGVKVKVPANGAIQKEEAESITEISKKVLGSYIKKATHDATGAAFNSAATDPMWSNHPGVRMNRHGDFIYSKAAQKADDVAQKHDSHRAKRERGIEKAADRLAGKVPVKTSTKGHRGWVARNVKEEAEQIDEISKKTLGRYLQGDPKRSGIGAVQDYSNIRLVGTGINQARPNDPNPDPTYSRLAKNRKTGIDRAINRLTKEEAEQIDEISMNKLADYAAKTIGHKRDNERQEKNRSKGLVTAMRKAAGVKVKVPATGELRKEDVEQIDELSSKTLQSYGQKALKSASEMDDEDKRNKRLDMADKALSKWRKKRMN